MMRSELRRLGVTAAALLLAATVGGCAGSRDSLAHSCTATDKRFIRTASVDVAALGMWAQDYSSGQVGAKQVAKLSFDAAKRVGHVEAHDPSLRKAQSYLDGMFMEYGEAVILHGKGKPAGAPMRRAYGLANFAHDVLAEAQPALQREGCEVGPLL